MITFKIHSLNISNMQYGIINYSHYAVHYTPMIYLFYNWKFIPFDALSPFRPVLVPCYWQPPIGSLYL